MLTQPRFIVNLKKSDQTHTQDLVYIGARFWTDLGRVYLPEDQIDELVRSFSKVGQCKTALLFLGLLGLMAAMLQPVVCPPSHASHPFVPEANLQPHNLIIVIRDRNQVLQWWWWSSQGTLFPGNALFFTQHRYHYHYGCMHGGMGWSLPTARVNYGTLQWPLVKVSSPYSTTSGVGDPQSPNANRV